MLEVRGIAGRLEDGRAWVFGGRSGPRWLRVVSYLLIFVGAVITLTPFLYMIGTALNPERWIMPFPPTIWPANPTLDNFVRAWNEANFQRYTLNSFIVSTVTVGLTFLVAVPSAFAFARIRFPGRELIFSGYLITMMIPDLIALLPKFQVIRDFGLANSWLGLWVIYVSNGVAFNTFLLRGFFATLPHDLEDATYIDGGSRFTVLTRVLIPLSTPALATLAVFTFLGAWDDFWWARLLLTDDAIRTLPIGIQLYFNAHGTQWSTVFAASTLAAIPEIVLFVALQRYFVSGLYSGSTRG